MFVKKKKKMFVQVKRVNVISTQGHKRELLVQVIML